MAQQVRHGLLAAVRQLLRPLVKLLIEQGVTHDEFAAVGKEIYVEVALRSVAGDSQKESLVSAETITGIDQKDIQKTINATLDGKNEESNKAKLVERVLLAWHTEPDFVGPYGFPLELPFNSEFPDRPSIEKLAERFDQGSSAAKILDELVRVRAVRKIDTGEFKVLRRDYIPEALAPSSLERFGEVVGNFIATVAHNLSNSKEEDRRFERHVVADDGVTDADFKKFDEYVKDQGLAFLVRVDDWFVTDTAKPPEKGAKNPIATGLGLYHYIIGSEEQQTFREFLVKQGLRKDPSQESR